MNLKKPSKMQGESWKFQRRLQCLEEKGTKRRSSFQETEAKSCASNKIPNNDVTRSTHTDLDVIQETSIDDYWNVDSNRHLSDSWKGFMKFTLLKEKHPKGNIYGPRRD